MEILVISENKLKIMLERSDMKKYGLLGSDLNYDDPPTRQKLLRVLEHAKAESGFDAAQDKLLVQLYPSKEGGSEMFVTRLPALSVSAEQSIRRSKGIGVFVQGVEIFFTSDFSSVLRLAAALRNVPHTERSRLYFEEDRGYYLVFSAQDGGTLSPLLPACEFADAVPAALAPYIEEYAVSLIGENAVEVLCEALA